jgi:hypothetical protein
MINTEAKRGHRTDHIALFLHIDNTPPHLVHSKFDPMVHSRFCLHNLTNGRVQPSVDSCWHSIGETENVPEPSRQGKRPGL